MPTKTPTTDTERLDALDGAALIAAERRRQVELEGWTPEHDDEHEDSELARVAACYALPDFTRPYQDTGSLPMWWPADWHPAWWKPSTDGSHAGRIRELTKAGALIAAEIDRLKRRQAIDQSLLAKEGE